MSPSGPPPLFLGGKPLQVGKRIGRGGEGEVYLLAGNPKRALKVYKEEKRAEREPKVRAMAALGLGRCFDLVAFPDDIVSLRTGEFAGFTMRLIEGFSALHQLYGPTSRQKHFPQADYRFLVRAAANAARAVAQVHQSPCIIGDLNESGLLVSPDAIVALIDADSFQIEVGARRYPCLVGKPDFTAPELQRRSLKNLIRTKSHDNFGLAVAIFHLLFESRHPYAGNVTGRDLTLTEMIAANRFPHSKRRQTGATPPNLPLPLDSFPSYIVDGFEDAFGLYPNKRPSAVEWADLLQRLEETLVRCVANTAHYYPPTATRCPWCRADAVKAAAARAPKKVVTNVVQIPFISPPPPTPPPTSPPQLVAAASPPRPHNSPNFAVWKWLVGAVVGLWVISSFRSCVAGQHIEAPDPPGPQRVKAPTAVVTPEAAPSTQPTYETSFNCSRNLTWVEQQICSRQPLAESDRHLASVYSSAMARAKDADRVGLRRSQRDWLKVRGGCSDLPCIERSYSERLAVLENWQPAPVDSPKAVGDAIGTRYAPQPIQDAVPAERSNVGSVTCILPYGEERQTSAQECERLGGSVYR